MSFKLEDIPVKFYDLKTAGCKKHPLVKTVAELKLLLNELPDDLPIDSDYQYLIVTHHLPEDKYKLHFDEYGC